MWRNGIRWNYHWESAAGWSCRAIINSPSVLVLDELTASLDEDTIWDLFHLIGELNRLGTTVIMATHAKNFVNLMRKRVITLVDGRIFGDVRNGRYGDVM